MEKIRLLVLLILASLQAAHTFESRFRKKLGVGNLTKEESKDNKDIETQWFKQLLDHFDPTTVPTTWNQKYFTNNEFFKKTEDAPIFLMIEGEGPANPVWAKWGAFTVPAKKHGALILQLEHRFYGDSHPTTDASTENLKYLSSEQAIADVAYFIEAQNKLYNFSKKNKWVVFGGSYAGNLAAWARLKYPHLVHAAVSSSAPLLAKADFKEYYQVVAASLGTHSKNCVKYVKNANQKLEKLLKNKKGRDQIKKLFRLCTPINQKNKDDVASLFEALSGNFAFVVQYNDSLTLRRNISIEKICGIMTNKAIGEPIKRYAAVNKLISTISESKCLDYSYNTFIKQMHETNWTSDAVRSSYRQWYYQTCTEYGYYQTSSTKKSIFGTKFPISHYEKMCEDVYGTQFNATLLNADVSRTNLIFGDLNIEANRIVHVHGSIDPWHALGITHSPSEDQPAIFIKGTSHCSNMYPGYDTDSAELKEAREKINKLIDIWVKE